MNFKLLFVLAFLAASSNAFYYYSPYYTYSSYYPSLHNYGYSGYYPSYYGYTGASYYPYYGYYGFGSNQNTNDIKNSPVQEDFTGAGLTNNHPKRL